MKNLPKYKYILVVLISIIIFILIRLSFVFIFKKGSDYVFKRELTYSDSLNYYLNNMPNVIDKLNKENTLTTPIYRMDSIRYSNVDTSLNYYGTFYNNFISDFDTLNFKLDTKKALDSAIVMNDNLSNMKYYKIKFYYWYFDKEKKLVGKIQAEY